MLAHQQKKFEEALLGIIMGCDTMSLRLDKLDVVTAQIQEEQKKREEAQSDVELRERLDFNRINSRLDNLEKLHLWAEKERERQTENVSQMQEKLGLTLMRSRLDELENARTQVEQCEREQKAQGKKLVGLNEKVAKLGLEELRSRVERDFSDIYGKLAALSQTADHWEGTASARTTLGADSEADKGPSISIPVDNVCKRLDIVESALSEVMDAVKAHAQQFRCLQRCAPPSEMSTFSPFSPASARVSNGMEHLQVSPVPTTASASPSSLQVDASVVGTQPGFVHSTPPAFCLGMAPTPEMPSPKPQPPAEVCRAPAPPHIGAPTSGVPVSLGRMASNPAIMPVCMQPAMHTVISPRFMGHCR